MDKETFEEMKSTIMKVMSSEENGILLNVSEKKLFIQDKDVDHGIHVTNEIGAIFEMDKKTFEEMKSSFFSTQQDDKDLYGTNEPGKPGTLPATAAPRGRAYEPTPATVSSFVDMADYSLREAIYVCEKCTKSFRSFDRITLHLMSCHSLNPLRHHTCSQCHQTYNTKRALNKHMRARHIHMARNNRAGPGSNPRSQPPVIAYLMASDFPTSENGECLIVVPHRIPEARSRTNAANGNRSRSGNAGTRNAGTRNAGNSAGTRNAGMRYARNANARARNARMRKEASRNSGTPNAGTSNAGTSNVETSNAEINEIVNVGINNMGSVIAGIDNVEIANAGTAKAEKANDGVVNAGTTNAETAAGNGTLTL